MQVLHQCSLLCAICKALSSLSFGIPCMVLHSISHSILSIASRFVQELTRISREGLQTTVIQRNLLHYRQVVKAVT